MKPGVAILCLVLVGCEPASRDVLGTLEADRIVLPASAFERIEAIAVREGEQVVAGQLLVTLDTTTSAAQLAALQADIRRLTEALAELDAGSRPESVRGAAARLTQTQARLTDARAQLQRIAPLAKRGVLPALDAERAQASVAAARADVDAARAALDEVEAGARVQTKAQARAALDVAIAQAAAVRAALDKLSVHAPRAGSIERLSYRVGEQPPQGAPLAILLASGSRYARVYVPQPLRLRIDIGSAATVSLPDGRSARGALRSVRSEPVFTPYYALAGDDAERLSYLAEIELQGADDWPLGVPLRAVFEPAP